MRCPQCESKNLYKATSNRFVCRDCKKSSRPEDLLPLITLTSELNKESGVNSNLETLQLEQEVNNLSPKIPMPPKLPIPPKPSSNTDNIVLDDDPDMKVIFQQLIAQNDNVLKELQDIKQETRFLFNEVSTFNKNFVKNISSGVLAAMFTVILIGIALQVLIGLFFIF